MNPDSWPEPRGEELCLAPVLHDRRCLSHAPGVRKPGQPKRARPARHKQLIANTAGLLLSAIVNVFFGFSSAVFTLGFLWMLNGWVQGMGFPPCARLMTHWFSPKQLATHFSIWNTSHSIGAGLVVVLCGYLATYDWRLCFLCRQP